MAPEDVATLIGELLEADDVEADDNFFDLGGTSFVALQLITEIERCSGVTLSLIDVVHSPTPARLAARVREESTVAG